MRSGLAVLLPDCLVVIIVIVDVHVLVSGDEKGGVALPRGETLGRRQRDHDHDRHQPHVSLLVLYIRLGSMNRWG